MATEMKPDWFARLSAAVRKDPKKPGIMFVLAAIMLGMWGRLLFQGPNSAAASIGRALQSGNVLPAASGSSHRVENVALVDWLSEKNRPVERNLFAVNLDYFPVDPITAVKHVGGSNNENADELGKSDEGQSDQNKERATLQTQVSSLQLFSTVMSSPPKALLNGVVVEEGNTIDAFRVVKIEPRRVVVEQNEIQFEIVMK